MAAASEEPAAPEAGQEIALVIVAPYCVAFASRKWSHAQAAARHLQVAADRAWEAGGAQIPGVKREPFDVVLVKVRLEDTTLPWDLTRTIAWDTYKAHMKEDHRDIFPWK